MFICLLMEKNRQFLFYSKPVSILKKKKRDFLYRAVEKNGKEIEAKEEGFQFFANEVTRVLFFLNFYLMEVTRRSQHNNQNQ